MCVCIIILCTSETSIAEQRRKTRLVETINQNLINLRFVFTIMLYYCFVVSAAWLCETQLRRTLSRI